MGRLIDADELIKEYPQASGLKLVIENAPTAYDVDKVVEELETLEHFADKYTTSKQGIVLMAKEIVRKGGVNE